MKNILHYSIFALLVLASANAQPATTNPSSVIRKALLTATLFPEKTVASAEIKEVTLGSNLKTGLHLHPCPVVGVITEGEILFQLEGQPVQHLHPGDAFHEPANTRVAHFDNVGDTPAKFIAIYLLGKDDHELIRMLPH